MALPTSPEMQAYAAEQMVAWMREQEETLRTLLGQWVSGLEPVIMYDYGLGIMRIKGIGIADDPTGMVVVADPKYRPARNIIRDIYR